jgi:hypothetical protein
MDNIFIAHPYAQMNRALWATGKSEYLGIKAHAGRIRVDAHQRLQERIVHHAKLNRTQVVPHKPFYAVDATVADFTVKGIIADFNEVDVSSAKNAHAAGAERPRVSELPDDQKRWFSFEDYIDADRRPIDRNPRFELLDIADCPQASYSMRTRAHAVSSWDDDYEQRPHASDVETTKFGHEPTHVCYLGKAPSVAVNERNISKARHKELLHELTAVQEHGREGHKVGLVQSSADIQWSEAEIRSRIATLKKNERLLEDEIGRQARTDGVVPPEEEAQPAQSGHDNQHGQPDDADHFRQEIRVHEPRIMWNEQSRNVSR